MKESTAKVVEQSEDLPPLTLATRLDDRRLSAPRPGVGACPPLRKACFITEQQQSFFLARQSDNLRPRPAPPALPRHFVEMIRDKSSFLKTEAEILQQLGNVEDAVADSEFLDHQVLNHGRTPTCAVETTESRSRFNQARQFLLPRLG